MTTTSAGWYADDQGTMRWWDGAAWTDQVADADVASAGSPIASRTPRLWIAWVILGLVVAGVLVGVGMLIPMLATAWPASGTPSGEVVAGAPTETPAEDRQGDETAAADALTLYATAWSEIDCEKFMQSTTKMMRNSLELLDCAQFEAAAHARATSMSPYELTVTSVELDGPSSMTVSTSDPIQILTDESGESVDPAIVISLYAFHLALTADGWAVDAAYDLSDGRAESETTSDEHVEAVDVANGWVQGLTAGDCEAFAAATTSEFRARNGWSDCAGLTQYIAQRNLESEFSVQVRDVHFHNRMDPHFGEIIVSTLETWVYHTAQNGEVLDPPVSNTRVVELHLVSQDGRWVVGNIFDGDTPR